MKLYSCKVRLGGSLYNELTKSEVTAPEIVIFKHLHGDDAVREIIDLGKKAMTDDENPDDRPYGQREKTTQHVRTQSEERERLIELYGLGLVAQQKAKTSPAQAVAEIFGISGRLPDDVDGAVKATPKAAPKKAPEPEPEAEAPNPEE